jgi:hypothetical protein
METSGRKVLRSGNVFTWKIAEAGDRGCVLGRFENQDRPTEADLSEARDLVASLVPWNVETVSPVNVGTRKELAEKALDHLTHNAKHN